MARPHTHNLLAVFAIGVAFACILLEVRGVEKSATRAVEVEPPVLEYEGTLHPEQTAYRPGESIYFSVTWRIMLAGREPVPILVFSCFEKLDDGLTYPLPAVPHVIGEGKTVIEGLQTRRVVRLLPANITPGKYRLRGWAETHTDKLRQSARFESDIFEVKP